MPPKIYLPFWKAEEPTEITAINKSQIEEFKAAYWAHTDRGFEIYDAISPAFINRLAEDATNAKRSLRDVLSRSDYWLEDLQALKIPMVHERTPNYNRIYQCLISIWRNKDEWYDLNYSVRDKLQDIAAFIASPDEKAGADVADELEQVAPRIYREGQKKTKLFTKLSLKLGLGDPNQGTSYQNQLWQAACEEFKAGAEHYSLYLSINPAHFLSMSNPVGDTRGDSMVSCHSFNSGGYKGGCVGYARDNVTMIAFVAADEGEGLLNRKTSRQLFFYHGGALIQSRLYTSRNSGSYGGISSSEASEYWEYKDFRLAVQTQISVGEAEPNRWITCPYRTRRGSLNKYNVLAYKHVSFDGYPDWEAFAGHKGLIKLSILKSAKKRLEDFAVGATCLDPKTGEERAHAFNITA